MGKCQSDLVWCDKKEIPVLPECIPLAGATEKINDWILGGARLPVEELNKLLYMAMPERIRNLVIFNEMDADTAKMIARAAYQE